MTGPRAAVTLVVICAALGVGLGGLLGIAIAPLAHADPPIGDGSLVGDTLSVGASVIDDGTQAASNLATGGSPGDANSSGGGGGEPSPYSTTRHHYGDHNDPGYGVNSPFPCPTNPDGSDQLPYEDVTTDTRDGTVTNRRTGCQAQGESAPAGTGTNAAPAPPTAAELWNATPVPAPAPGIKGTTGLTGAATWIWSPAGDGPVGVTVTIRGYTATSTASPERWEWDMTASGPESRRNPPGLVTSDRPGSSSDPAVTYRYETTGDYQIEARVVWSGSFTFSGNGQPSQTRSLGTTTRTARFPYHVTQAYGVSVAS